MAGTSFYLQLGCTRNYWVSHTVKATLLPLRRAAAPRSRSMNRLNRAFNRLRNRPHATLSLLAILSAVVFLATIPLSRLDGMLIGSDGVGYYIYVHSLVMDGDLDFANEHARLYPDEDLAEVRTP